MKLNLLKLGLKGRGAPPAAQPSQPTPPPQQPKNTPPAQPAKSSTASPAAPPLNRVQAGTISLVTNTPEKALMQVEQESADIIFGESGQHKFMANLNQNWALVGPLLFAIATVMEIFLVLWSFMKEEDHNAFYGATLLAVSVIAEVTLVTVSYSAHLLRARAARRPTGMSRQEKEELGKIKWIWWLLSICIATTQVFFVITQSDTTKFDLTTMISIAIVRAAASLVADYYTAYISKEKPNNAEQALEVKAQQTEFAQKTLEGESKKIAVINAGSIQVQEAAQAARIEQARTEQKASMEMDRLRTEQELARLENENRIAKARAQYENEAEWSKLQIAYMRDSQARLAQAAESLKGDSPRDKEITSTLRYIVSEVKDLKGQLGSGTTSTEPLRIVNGQQQEADD